MAFPQSENLARLMISMLSEQLRSCHSLKKKVWKPKQRNALGIQMNGRKSDTAILSQKSVKADGEKGCALYSFKNKELCRQKRADKHGE